ncbi:MAG TPA: histidine kinase, partial [Casimicrobiaceae bacterium]
CAAAACVELSTAGRGRILIEQGVVQNSQTMHFYAFVSALIMALLFFVHLQQSRVQEEAAARLASAQAAQLEARRRAVRARLQALQARIDPQLLFDLLETVRHSYDDDPSRAERLLDELVAFLRAALPRLRSESSSLSREADLARAYARLRALAGAKGVEMRLDLAGDVMGARFPPGVLLPLLDDALRAQPGVCTLKVERAGGECRIALSLSASPSQAVVARIRGVLTELYGAAAELLVVHASGVACATVKVPYELA